LFENFSEIVESIYDAVMIYSLVGIDRIIAATATKNKIDELCLGCFR